MDGRKKAADGSILNEGLKGAPIHIGNASITGTQLQTMFTAPQVVVAGVTSKYIVPVGWHVYLDHAGGTNFSGNDDLELITATDFNVFGEAANAIAGSADKLTIGTIASVEAVVSDSLSVRVKTGNPTGGHATASLKVKVWYVLV